jgi:hypothetical protein
LGPLSKSLHLIEDLKQIVGRSISQTVYLLDQERDLQPIKRRVAVAIDEAEKRVGGVALWQSPSQHTLWIKYDFKRRAAFVLEFCIDSHIGERNYAASGAARARLSACNKRASITRSV